MPKIKFKNISLNELIMFSSKSSKNHKLRIIRDKSNLNDYDDSPRKFFRRKVRQNDIFDDDIHEEDDLTTVDLSDFDNYEKIDEVYESEDNNDFFDEDDLYENEFEESYEERKSPIRYILAISFTVLISLMIWVFVNWINSNESDKSIPIIESDQNVYKVLPETPGGSFIPYQDRYVYDHIDSENESSISMDNSIENIKVSNEENINEKEKTTKDDTGNKKSVNIVIPEGFVLVPKDTFNALQSELIQMKKNQNTKTPTVVKNEEKTEEKSNTTNKLDEKQSLDNLVEKNSKIKKLNTFYLQLGSFKTKLGATKELKRLKSMDSFKNIQISISQSGDYYVLKAGPFKDRKTLDENKRIINR